MHIYRVSAVCSVSVTDGDSEEANNALTETPEPFLQHGNRQP